VRDNDFLNFKAKSRDGWGYCVFGKVIDGMDVVTSIEGSATTTRAGHQDVPQEDVVINRAVKI
jgi:peptidyl-prolyl cis-trans isomerase B (cyclophilin B)